MTSLLHLSLEFSKSSFSRTGSRLSKPSPTVQLSGLEGQIQDFSYEGVDSLEMK